MWAPLCECFILACPFHPVLQLGLHKIEQVNKPQRVSGLVILRAFSFSWLPTLMSHMQILSEWVTSLKRKLGLCQWDIFILKDLLTKPNIDNFELVGGGCVYQKSCVYQNCTKITSSSRAEYICLVIWLCVYLNRGENNLLQCWSFVLFYMVLDFLYIKNVISSSF